VKTDKLVIGYICTFLGIYLLTFVSSIVMNIKSEPDAQHDLIGTGNMTMAISAIGAPQATVFAGFSLVIVGIIILIAFGLVNTFSAF